MSSGRAPEIFNKEALLEIDFSLLGNDKNVRIFSHYEYLNIYRICYIGHCLEICTFD